MIIRSQFSTRIRARRTLEEHNEMKTFKMIVLKVWNSKSFRKKTVLIIWHSKSFRKKRKSHWSWWYHFLPLCFFLWIQVGVRFVKNNWQCKEIRNCLKPLDQRIWMVGLTSFYFELIFDENMMIVHMQIENCKQ